MSISANIIRTALAAAILACAAPIAHAAPGKGKANKVHPHAAQMHYNGYQNPYAMQFAQVQISPRQAKKIVLSRMPGAHVLDIRLVGPVYKVRVQTKDGVVSDVLVDAVTGRVR